MRLIWGVAFLCGVQADHSDGISLVQRTVQESMQYVAPASIGTAAGMVKAEHNSILANRRKQWLFAAMMGKLSRMLESADPSAGKGVRERLKDWLKPWTTEAIVSCAKGPSVGITDYGLALPNAIANVQGCAAGDGLCLTKEILGGLVSPTLDLAMDMYNIEQDCGCPLLQDLKDCDPDTDQGYFGTPRSKNNISLAVRSASWLGAAVAGVMGAAMTCNARLGGQQSPVSPEPGIGLAGGALLISVNELIQLSGFVKNESKGGFVEFCAAGSAVLSDGLGLATAIMDTVAHHVYDANNTGKGWQYLCASDVMGAIDALPALANNLCSWKSCEDGFPKAAFRRWEWGSWGSGDASANKCGVTDDSAPATPTTATATDDAGP